MADDCEEQGMMMQGGRNKAVVLVLYPLPFFITQINRDKWTNNDANAPMERFRLFSIIHIARFRG